MKPFGIAKPKLLALAVALLAGGVLMTNAQTNPQTNPKKAPMFEPTTFERNMTAMRAYAAAHDAMTAYRPDATFQDMSRPEPFRGREAIQQVLKTFYGGAFKDGDWEFRSMVASPDATRVAMEFVFTGTHTGDLFGIPPTGKKVSIPMMTSYEIQDGQIRAARLYYDTATLMRQLGLMQ